MGKSADSKLRLLYLLRYLLRQTDEAHPAGIADMLAELERYDITANRKTVYDDLEALRLFGLDIVTTKSHATGYYVASRDFELPELKLLVDSVQSSKFITQKKTLSLIRKIEGLTSVHEGQLLQRQVYVHNRVKTMNESVYYNVDEISGAISRDRGIRFRYFDYAPDGSRLYRHDGAFYQVSPFALMWDNENYYLLGWDEESEELRHYRVDKMERIAARSEPRRGRDDFAKVDMASYSQQVFGMFGGAVQAVRMRFARHLAGAVIDRFGHGLILAPDGEAHFTVTAPVAVSPQFYAWLLGFGSEAEILGPAAVREGLKRHLAEAAKLYE
ncbi:MAG: WYL domain-containing protein [Eubacteriales bacterium]|nr:WYL domain-containing protein [Eubacteriales bacterium]